MKPTKRILWGIVLVAVGVIYAIKALGIADIDIFFDGWWTVFIIVPCAISVATDKDKTFGIVGVFVGIGLLAWKQEWIDFDYIWKLAIPALIIVTGLSMIFQDLFNGKSKKAIKKLNSEKRNFKDIRAFLSRKNIAVSDTVENVQLVCACASMNIDLTNAVIADEVVINARSAIGTVNIIVPDGVNVKVVSRSILGGVNNSKKDNIENNPTIYVNGFAVIGNINIK